MKIAVVPNYNKEEALSCTEEIVNIISSNGGESVLISDLFDKSGNFRDSDIGEFADCDIVIAVGGDGTIIHTAKLAAKHGKPILGVNAGTLGFTAGLEKNELSLLSNLFDGKYREEKRLMVSVTLISDGREKSFIALNDAVVSGETASIIDYNMALGENKGYHYRADGFIVAAPTGSTAYSLSAGGPVIQPDMECLVYTPVCSHALFGRSVIFGGDTRLKVTIPENKGRLYLTVDGEPPVLLKNGDKLIFSKADLSAKFIKLGKNDFYDVLNKKILSEN